MTLTTHAAAGMVVAQYTQSPFLGFLFAMGTHYFLDAIPHGDEFLYIRHKQKGGDLLATLWSAIDLFALTILLLAVLNIRENNDTLMIIIGAIGGILPDLMMLIHKDENTQENNSFFGSLQHSWHSFIHSHYLFHKAWHDAIRTPIRFRTGVFYQIVMLTFFVYYFIG